MKNGDMEAQVGPLDFVREKTRDLGMRAVVGQRFPERVDEESGIVVLYDGDSVRGDVQIAALMERYLRERGHGRYHVSVAHVESWVARERRALATLRRLVAWWRTLTIVAWLTAAILLWGYLLQVSP